MSAEERPYIDSCSFCGDGLLRFLRCKNCETVVVLCDECELMWSDVKAVSEDANLSSDSGYPRCPHCGHDEAEFDWLSMEDLKDHKLEKFASSESV